MARDVDSFLLDNVFQPAADAVSDWLDCFDLARVSLISALGVQTALLAWCLSRMPDPVQLAMVAAGTMAEYVAAQMLLGQIRRLRRQTRPGMMNIARITYRPLRLVWVAFAAAGTLFWLSSEFRIIDFLNLGVGFLWVLTVYFMCCAARPPRQRIRIGSRAFAGIGAR
jgi:peptidoglycan biosynthesis protein MviN/MurJ (putative lipid II flippase)